MKKIVLGTLSLAAMTLMSCGGSHTEESHSDASQEGHEAPAEEVAAAENYSVDVAASTVHWKGEVAGVYGHDGIVSLQSGALTVEGDQIRGGEFIVDMNTIVPQDSGYSEESPKEKLVGHLATADFFAIEEHPTAKFVVSSATTNEIKGTLTVRGKSNEETVVLESFESTADGIKASGKLVFDRQKYDVAWVHYMKDMVLSDDITLDLEIIAKK